MVQVCAEALFLPCQAQVLYSYIFGVVLFNEHITLFGVLGSILVALGEWLGAYEISTGVPVNTVACDDQQ